MIYGNTCFRIFFFISIILANSSSYAEAVDDSLPLQISDNNTADTEDTRRITNDSIFAKPEFAIALISTVVSVITIAVSIGLYWHQQASNRKNIIKNACETISRELEENRTSLETRNHIKYTIDEGATEAQRVDYTNARLDTDAYESVLHSGLFTNFKKETQHELSMLYGRIKARNEMIVYLNKFQDEFYLDDSSDHRKSAWYEARKRYDLILTEWQDEILQLLDNVVQRIDDEKRKVS